MKFELILRSFRPPIWLFCSAWPNKGRHFFCSVHRLHYTQNVRLELRISTQISFLKNMHRGPRYWPNCGEKWRFGLASQNLSHFDTLLGLRGIFFKTDFCVEILSLSRMFWVYEAYEREFFLPLLGKVEQKSRTSWGWAVPSSGQA